MDNSKSNITNTMQLGMYPITGYPLIPMEMQMQMQMLMQQMQQMLHLHKIPIQFYPKEFNELDINSYKEHLLDIQNKIKIISDKVNETIKQIESSAVKKEINEQIDNQVKKKNEKKSNKNLNFLAAIKNEEANKANEVKEANEAKEDKEDKEVKKTLEKKNKISRTDEENKKLKEKLEECSKVYFEHLKNCIDNAIPGLEGQDARYKDISANITSLVGWHVGQYGVPIPTTNDYTKRNIKPYIDLGVERGFITAQKYALDKGFKLIDISDPERGSKKVMIVLCTIDRIMQQEKKILWHGLNKLPIIN